MNKNFLSIIFIIITAATLLTTEAFAASPTKSFYKEIGFSLGARRGGLTMKNTTFYSPWELDGGINVGIGIPVWKKLILSFDGYWTARHNKLNDTKSEFTNNFDILAQGHYYLFDSLSIKAGLGFAYLLNDYYADQGNGKSGKRNLISEPGMGIRIALGYEITSFSSKYNIGLQTYYMHNFYFPTKTTLTYLTLGAGIFLHWY